MRTNVDYRPAAAAILSALLLAPLPALAQRAGQSVSVQYGVVKGGKPVELQSGAVPAGALVGGTLGLMSASGKSSGKKARNSIIGVAAGAAIAGAAKGPSTGMLYEIDLGSGAAMQVVTDQREIRTGDCVAIEKAGETANLRRVTAAYCDQANAAAVRAVADEATEEAEECLAAKQQLVDAQTVEAVDLAERKIALLCND
ncbi:MAG TPA: hypothetical protein VLA66_04750 [Thermoanaerobaculia bacterium]|nr:hypothetical protein [Thermoanaerobaculia bacterium]